MSFTPEQLQEKWDRVMELINDHIQSPRKEQLIALYEKYQERILLAPASSIEHFHNAFPGGYIDHVIHVVDNAMAIYAVWKSAGAEVDNFTAEELVFSALNHDLGKIGDESGEYYVPNLSDWHRTNQGTIYNINPDLQYMNVTDRTFFILQTAGIPVTRNEYLTIQLTDGLYEEKNKPYLVSFNKNNQLKFNLPIILHHADMLALHVERDAWRKNNTPEANIAKISPQTAPKKFKSDPQKRNADLKATFEKSTNASMLFEQLVNGNKNKSE